MYIMLNRISKTAIKNQNLVYLNLANEVDQQTQNIISAIYENGNYSSKL